MLEKILQKMKAQRGTTSNVSDRSLEDLAKSYVVFITTDEQLTKADFTSVIVSLDGNINHYTAEAVKKAELLKQQETAKKAADDAAKKAADDAAKKKEGKQTDLPEYVKAIMEKLDVQSEELSKLKNDKVNTSRKDDLKKTLVGLPEWYTKPILSNFEKIPFTTDQDYEAYKADLSVQSEAFKQAAKEQGLNTTFPSNEVKPPVIDGGTPELNKAREILKTLKEKQK